MENESNFKPNWLAIAAVVIGLITVGWLLGVVVKSPSGKTIDCPEEDMIQVARVGDHVIVYCEE